MAAACRGTRDSEGMRQATVPQLPTRDLGEACRPDRGMRRGLARTLPHLVGLGGDAPRPLPRGPEGPGKNVSFVDDRRGGRGQREGRQQQHGQQRRQLRNAGNAYAKAAKDADLFKHDLSRAARTASRGDTRDPCWLIAALVGFDKDG